MDTEEILLETVIFSLFLLQLKSLLVIFHTRQSLNTFNVTTSKTNMYFASSDPGFKEFAINLLARPIDVLGFPIH